MTAASTNGAVGNQSAPPAPPAVASPAKPGAATDGPWLARIRAAHRDMHGLITARASASVAAIRARDEALANAAQKLAEASTAAETAHASAIAQTDGRLAETRDQIEKRTTADNTQARLALAAGNSMAEERAQSEIGSAKKKLDDRVWMAESLFDTSKDKPRLAFESLKKTLDARLAVVDGLRQQATWWLAYYRQRPLPKAQGRVPDTATPPPPDEAATLEVIGEKPDKPAKPEASPLVTLFLSTCDKAAETTTRLGHLRLPRLFVSILPVLMALGFGICIGVLFSFLDGWAWNQRVLWGAGFGALLAGGFLVWLLSVSRRRSDALSAELAQFIADAAELHKAALEDAATTRKAQEKAIAHRRERELRQAKQLFQEVDTAARKRHAEDLAAAKEKHAAAVVAIASRRTADLAEIEQRHRVERELAEKTFAEAKQAAQSESEQATSRAHANFTVAWRDLHSTWHNGMRAVQQAFGEVQGHVAALNPPWSGPEWDARTRLTDGPGAVRIATLDIDMGAVPDGIPSEPDLALAGPIRFAAPIVLEPPQRYSLLVQSGPEQRARVVAELRAAMMRVLTVFPPGKVRFTLIDPVGLGQSFAGFMHLADYEPALVGDRIWTETRHIEQRLTDLTEHMEVVIQKYLRNQFATIEQYNSFAGEVAEPYRFLVISDFPAAFSDQAAHRLASIIQSGPRCGVYTLIGADIRQKMPGAFGSAALQMSDLERSSLTLAWRRDQFALLDPELGQLPLEPEQPPDDARAQELVHEAGRLAKDSTRVQVPFDMIAPRQSEGQHPWTGDTTSDLRLPLGRLGAMKLQHLVLGRGTAQHVLIAGRTGSGKSTLLNVIITNAALWYSPAQIELYLIDFKKGVEFKAYAAHGVPHARVIAIESEREFGLSALRRLDDELKRRGQMFRDVGAQDVAAFRRAKPAEVLPRILLVIDEFQELFSEDDKLAQEAGLLLDRLVRQGRAFGMHVILGSQTLAGAYSLARSTIGQMAVRIALQCSEADSYLILSDDNSAARLLSRPGEAIYNDASGALEGNSPFQVAWLGDELREQQLRRVEEVAREQFGSGPRPDPPIVFEGNQPADVAANHLLARLLAGHARRDATRASATTPVAWLGEPVSIKDPTAAHFSRQSSSNLLIVGQRDESASAMLAASLIALSAQHGPLRAGSQAADISRSIGRFTVLDGTPADSPLVGVLPAARGALGQDQDEATLIAYRDVPMAMNALAEELQRRQTADLTDAPALFVIINGLQRFRVLRKQEEDFGVSFGEEKTATPDQQFVKLLRDGPTFGIFTLAWCDTVANLERTLPRQALKEFDMRVVFQMSQADSSALIDAPTAGALGQHRALFYSESQGVIEKFRPYRPPDDAWLARVSV